MSFQQQTKSQAITLSDLIVFDTLDLQVRYVVEGFLLGLHSSPYHGFSVEFSQHRPYNPGDDIRHLDWKVYGRTNRYYIRQYEQDTNLSAYLLVDCSHSMGFGSPFSKFYAASIIAASLATLLVRQNDAVGLCLFQDKPITVMPPKAISSYPIEMMKCLSMTDVKGKTSTAFTLHQMAESMTQRGLVLLISDLWDDPEAIIKGIQHVRYGGHEVLVVHVWNPNEMDLKKGKKTEFIDMETGEHIKADNRQIRDLYRQTVLALQKTYLESFGNMGVDYLFFRTDDDLRTVLMTYLLKRNTMM
ncbi:MAG: DUF58 domain-containing protein [Candidatus Marinimicrobia bacterium]|nr:DUF58 domain-containing protein [Candidatus Neomarinimicrobiota bacterium]MDD5582831.1 DUF58 domain-containing protein [Candidatus Neomarinimicrobiota bacterium]